LGKGRKLRVYRDSDDLEYMGTKENFTLAFEYRYYFSYDLEIG
jgi:hypothetical protein